MQRCSKYYPYAIIAVYAAKEAGRYMQAYFTAYIGQDIIKRLRNNILENLLKLDLSFFMNTVLVN